MKGLEWNVYIASFNGKVIEKYNVFEHQGFLNDCNEAWSSYKNDFQKFAESVKRSLSYYFWSKCEWEIILSCFPPYKKFKDEKIDVYDQVMMNWEIFINYVWDQYVFGMVD